LVLSLLVVERNAIKSEGVLSILNALKDNKTLTALYLSKEKDKGIDDNEATISEEKEILDLVIKNKIKTSLSLCTSLFNVLGGNELDEFACMDISMAIEENKLLDEL